MRVLVACEFSGRVRDSFTARGHDAESCDLLPSDTPGSHYRGDVRDLFDETWDLMIAFPPCTDLAGSGARWFSAKRADGRQQTSLDFVSDLLNAPIPRIALENPIGIISSYFRKSDQIVQPWWFGHPETKSTCLWLKNLPKLHATNDVYDEMMKLTVAERNKVWYASPGPNRWKVRSTTYQGFADAMADQWGRLC